MHSGLKTVHHGLLPSANSYYTESSPASTADKSASQACQTNPFPAKWCMKEEAVGAQLWGSHQCLTKGSEERLTFGHGAGVDKRGQAAALAFAGVVAGVDLDLVAGEVLQAGDDG